MHVFFSLYVDIWDLENHALNFQSQGMANVNRNY